MSTRTEIMSGTNLCSVAVVLAGGINGLGVVRSLHVKGIDSIIVCRSDFDMGLFSRLPLRKVLIPTDRLLTDWLQEFSLSVRSVADCIIPTSDEFASVLRKLSLSCPEHLPCILPPEDLVDILNDKKSEIRLIQSIGVPCPETYLDLGDLDTDAKKLKFPMIVKPRKSQGQKILGAKNQILNNRGELDAFLMKFVADLDAFLAQEVILGDEKCQWVCNATFDQHSEMVSAFTFQRLGTKPYLYGVTTFAVSRHNDEIKSLCARIGKALRYTGPAMFEFKTDPRSGQYCYIEINPRLGMCNWFDTRCGVNNVYNTYALSVGIPPERNVDNQLDNVKFWDVGRDLYARVRAKQSVWSTVVLYLSNFPRKIICPSWYWRDPMPIFATPVGIAVRGFRLFVSKLKKSDA